MFLFVKNSFPIIVITVCQQYKFYLFLVHFFVFYICLISLPVLGFYFMYLLERQRETETDRGAVSYFTPQMAVTASARPA